MRLARWGLRRLLAAIARLKLVDLGNNLIRDDRCVRVLDAAAFLEANAHAWLIGMSAPACTRSILASLENLRQLANLNLKGNHFADGSDRYRQQVRRR